MEDKIKDIIKVMTLEEKASLCSGMDFWHTKPIKRLDIPSIMVADGPHGLRKQAENTDQLGLNESVPATCFPTASATGCSFDRELMFKMGQALAVECETEGVSVILGPGANIKRSPLCGRNFEYVSEDPYLTGEICSSLISGIQSRDVGTSLKHFAFNNQEKARMVSSSIVDERAKREIYLAGFEAAVKQAKPWTVMCSYNRVDGTFASESHRLLTEILREEWGYEGAVVSDWGAVNDRVAGVRAGLDLEMPATGGMNDKRIIEACKNGTLDEKSLDAAVENLLRLIYKGSTKCTEAANFDVQKHHDLARKIAVESAVLLKNEGVLPAPITGRFALIGQFAKKPRFQGGGSSRINPTRISPAYDEFQSLKLDFQYADGYSMKDEVDMDKLEEAKAVAASKDVVFVYAGLPDEYESEGFDREHMSMPQSHISLIEELAKVNENIVVVLHAGSAIEMPWLQNAKAVLLCHLAGQATGAASCDLLFGKMIPSGKLSESYPIKLSDNPSYRSFGGVKTVEYRESIYVGYRYYDKAKVPTLFPFGHGLSYSEFEYSNIVLSAESIQDTDTLTVAVDIKNLGPYDAKEVVQLYIAPPPSVIFKAEKELKGFEKVSLKVGEAKTISFKLEKRSFAYYNINIKDWHVESGSYKVEIGASSKDIRLCSEVQIRSTTTAEVPDYQKSAPYYYHLKDSGFDALQNQFEALYGAKVPDCSRKESMPFDENSTLGDVKHTFAGKILFNQVKRIFASSFAGENDGDVSNMFEASVNDMPLRAFVVFTGGMVSYEFLDGLICTLNRKYMKGIVMMLIAIRKQKKTTNK